MVFNRCSVQQWFNQLAPWIVPVLLIISWLLLSKNHLISSKFLPSPIDVVAAGIHLIQTGELFKHLLISFQRVAIGFLLGGSIGFVLGLFNGVFLLTYRLLDSSIQMIRNIPHLALIPLVVIWFGIGEEAKVFLVALGVLFPVYINTLHGIRSVDKGLLEMGNVYGLRPTALFWKIILPGALPAILVGVRYALGVMWLTLIVAETIAASSGIGFMAMNAREFMQTDIVVLSILLYALFGKLADSLARSLEKRFLKWNSAYITH